MAASSIEVFPLEQCQGKGHKFTSDVDDISIANGSGAKSCIITGPNTWTVFSSINQGGKAQVLQTGKYNTYDEMGMPNTGAMSAKLGST